MGVMGVFKWLRKDIVQRDRDRRSLTPKIDGLNNEAYRNALQAFIDRRKNPNESLCVISPNSPDKERLDFLNKRNNENKKKKRNDERETIIGIAGVPQVRASDIFEIGWIAGTEDRYMELMFAEWQSTRVSLRRHTHPDCRNAIKADLEVLTEIRHPNVLLLMATTNTDDHGLVAIFEPVDCTLYNFVHEQRERVSVQGIAKCAGNLADALKHAHMRGYVHGAISSHCVFLATSGVVKLGGWELAVSLDSPKAISDHDQRLRFEVFRWQAPEIFRGQDPSTATDVYGLALLMWEMCTMSIPWNGLSKSELESQYVEWERGVITDLYNFPPLLNKLLDAGLQLDVSKRTLDMSRMRRFLQTLEIQYEDAEPIYVEPLTNNNNNNNNHNKNNNPSKLMSNVEPEDRLINDSPSIQRYTSAPTPKRSSERKTVESRSYAPRSLDLSLIEEQEKFQQHDIMPFGRKDTATSGIIEKIFNATSVQCVNAKNVTKSCPGEKISIAGKLRHGEIGESEIKLPRETKLAKNLTQTLDSTRPLDSSRTLDSTRTINSTDNESSGNDTLLVSTKKIRQTLATKRNEFFYGNDSSHSSPNDDVNSEIKKSRILMEARSKDYEPHKPASHKTSLEPKQTKSPGQYNLTPPRLASHTCQRLPYSYVPTDVRDSIVQPKVLNTDSQSFFESSLWRKEKMICISKMRRDDIDDSTFRVSRNPRIKNVSTMEKSDSIGSNETYTIAPNNVTNVNDYMTDSTDSAINRSKSLQALKDSLERATDIVRSTATQEESLFENIYEIKHDDASDVEIKSIERNNGPETVFFSLDNKSDVTAENCQETAESTVRRRSSSSCCDEIKRASFDHTRLSSVVYESIAESLNESENSSSQSKPDDATIVLSRSSVNHENHQVAEISGTLEQRKNETEVKNHDESENNGFGLIVLSDKSRGCHSCNAKNNPARRRSLPAALGQLRNLSNVSLGKLPIRKGDVSDNTVEDIYFDDEFGDSLNVNMVFLDEDDATTDDEDFIPYVELSDA